MGTIFQIPILPQNNRRIKQWHIFYFGLSSTSQIHIQKTWDNFQQIA
jgi:hypothetical protein